MDRRFLTVAAVLGFVSVALGAFGAHALGTWLATLPDGATRLGWWEKAVHYHQVHSVALLALAVWAPVDPAAIRLRARACTALVVGVLIFSGTLYAMTLTGIRVLGAVTPIGGVSLLVGWALTAFAARRAS